MAEEPPAPKPDEKGPEGATAKSGVGQDEQLLKFAGTATAVVGLALLLVGTVAIVIVSVLKYDLAPWLPILPLSLLVVLVGGLINGYFRKVIARALNPPTTAPRTPPYGFVYPYQLPPAYMPRMPSPPQPAAMPTAPGSMAARGNPAAGASARFCIACGRRIPMDSKFCPYCRHVFA